MIYSGLIWLIEDNWIHQEISLWNCFALITYFQFFAKSANKMKIMYCALGPFQIFYLSVKLYSINNKHVILM